MCPGKVFPSLFRNLTVPFSHSHLFPHIDADSLCSFFQAAENNLLPSAPGRVLDSSPTTSKAEAIRGTSNISHKDFMAMLEPAWMKGSSLSDIKAVLKRTGILVLTNDFLYWRPATEAEVRVERSPLAKTSRCYEPAVAPSTCNTARAIAIYQKITPPTSNAKRHG